jgi:hypothetical protein
LTATWVGIGEAKEVEGLLFVDGKVVSDTSTRERHKVGTVSRLGPRRGRGVLLSRSGSRRKTENVGPLFDCFSKILIVERLIAEFSQSDMP